MFRVPRADSISRDVLANGSGLPLGKVSELPSRRGIPHRLRGVHRGDVDHVVNFDVAPGKSERRLVMAF